MGPPDPIVGLNEAFAKDVSVACSSVLVSATYQMEAYFNFPFCFFGLGSPFPTKLM